MQKLGRCGSALKPLYILLGVLYFKFIIGLVFKILICTVTNECSCQINAVVQYEPLKYNEAE